MVRPVEKSRVVTAHEDVDNVLQGTEGSICPQIDGATAKDRQVLKRVVGMLEYYLALRYLLPVWESATDEERTVMADQVRKLPEFEFYSGSGAESGAVEKRHDIVWILALARLEFDAIVAGFSHAKKPFAFTTDDSELQQAYDTLLLEAARHHIGELFNESDQPARQVKKKRPDAELLSIMKRLAMTHAFVQGVLQNDRRRTRLSVSTLQMLRHEDRRITSVMEQIRSNMLHFLKTNPKVLGPLERELVQRTVTLR